MNRPNRRLAGFTLLELVVALAVFSVLAAMAYGGLRAVLETSRHVDAQANRLARLQLGFTTLERDLEQISARGARDEAGNPQAPIVGGAGSLQFTRAGWRNPAQRARSRLQRVMYALADDKLQRAAWTTLDRAPGAQPGNHIILEGVKGLEVRFLDRDMQWQLIWPPAPLGDGQVGPMPRAIELTLDVEGYGRVQRLFRVPG